MPDSPTTDLKRFGLKVQPMVHVEKMAEALDFYEALGGRLVFGSRDGDWALVAFEGSMLSLLAQAPGDGKMETVELQFTSGRPLEEVEAQISATSTTFVDRGVADEAFGRMLKLRTPDGLTVKVLELDRELIA